MQQDERLGRWKWWSAFRRRSLLAKTLGAYRVDSQLQNHPDLAGLLTVDDVQALSYLVDFECEPTGETQLEGLKITFVRTVAITKVATALSFL